MKYTGLKKSDFEPFVPIKKLLQGQGHKVKADRTLTGYTKKELINCIRCFEHDYGLLLFWHEVSILVTQKLAERYTDDEYHDIFRAALTKMNKAWG